MLDLLIASAGITPAHGDIWQGREQKNRDNIISVITVAHKDHYRMLIDFWVTWEEMYSSCITRTTWLSSESLILLVLRCVSERNLFNVQIKSDEIYLINGFSRDLQNSFHFGSADV